MLMRKNVGRMCSSSALQLAAASAVAVPVAAVAAAELRGRASSSPAAPPCRWPSCDG